MGHLPASLNLEDRLSSSRDMDILEIPALRLELDSHARRGGDQGLAAESAIERPALLHRRSATRDGCREEKTGQLTGFRPPRHVLLGCRGRGEW
jgi:hypothetical protein